MQKSENRHLKVQFQKHVLRKLRRAEKLTDDSLGSIRNLIVDLGAVEVARLLVDPTEVMNPSTGSVRLMNHRLARLTIEQAIEDIAATGMTSDSEIETARARLAMFMT